MTDSSTPKSRLPEENQRLRSTLPEIKLSTEHHTVELQANGERFVLAMQGANDGLWDWNLETDEIYYSPRWKSMLGYTEHELENVLETWANLMHPDDRNRVLRMVDLYLSGEADSFEVEMRMLHKDGHFVYVLARAFSVFTEKNKPIRLVGTHVDISESKKVEEFNRQTARILEMIARGKPASEIYDAIALM